ncbi:hypothetical protein FB389_1224 [Rarobacter incanus]|uniref:Uncharacterized protein n=1 Tax=Rarobacter incanus TaxID=153494 RepID=A0A542SPJ5_9MICO|nr:hypothetical protein FB389_1224 [Rarobacter incanus]
MQVGWRSAGTWSSNGNGAGSYSQLEELRAGASLRLESLLILMMLV